MDDRGSDDLFMSVVSVSQSKFEKISAIYRFDRDRGSYQSNICTKRKNDPVCRCTSKNYKGSVALWDSLWMRVGKSVTGIFKI